MSSNFLKTCFTITPKARKIEIWGKRKSQGGFYLAIIEGICKKFIWRDFNFLESKVSVFFFNLFPLTSLCLSLFLYISSWMNEESYIAQKERVQRNKGHKRISAILKILKFFLKYYFWLERIMKTQENVRWKLGGRYNLF